MAMAVPQQPSLRSSRRSTYLPDPQPPTASPPVKQYLRKRTHDAFLAHKQDQPSKKLKPNSNPHSQAHLSSKPHAYTPAFSPLTKPTVGVTHTSNSPIPSPRITTAVQPLADGTLITNGYPRVQVERRINTDKVTNNDTGSGKPSKAADKRTLRSQAGGSRSRSELALYFPNYDELISNEPKESGT
jgi:hypothetical protein